MKKAIAALALKVFRATSQTGVSPRDPVLATWFGGGATSSSGMTVTADTAMQQSAVYACVRVLSETIAALPLKVYKRLDGGNREVDTKHPLHTILHDKPNRLQTSFEWREMQVGQTALRGNAYSRIVLTPRGAVGELIPLHPDRIQPVKFGSDNKLAWKYYPDSGQPVTLLDDEVLRIPGMTSDGIVGMNPIQMHRETIGLGLAVREHGARSFGNNATPKGGLKVSQALSPEASKQLRTSWNDRHKGPQNSGNIAIFDGGIEWVQMGMNNDDAQYLEVMQFSITDVARIFRVPPHKIGDLSRATFSNIEQQSIEFVVDTLLPWVTRIEQRFNTSLLSASEQGTHFIAFELKGLLRGDSAARAAYITARFNTGSISPNEIRRLDDENDIEGGDAYYIPANMVPVHLLEDQIKGRARVAE